MFEHKNKTSYVKSQQKLYQWAMGYLARYETTRYKLAKKLEEKFNQFEDMMDKEEYNALCTDVLQILEDKKYLSDARYAEQRARILLRRGKNIAAIKYDLKLAGIHNDTTQIMLEEISTYLDETCGLSINEYAAICYIKKHNFGAFRRKTLDEKMAKKEISSLLRQGFSYDLAKRTLDMHMQDIEETLFSTDL